MLQSTRTSFYNSLNQIVLDFISCWQLEFKQEMESLNDPLFRWLDFRLRYIEPIPRKVVISNKFPKKLPFIVETGFYLLVESLRNGLDVNPYQSKGLIRFNDISGRKRAKRTDLLWADWGIMHLHITDRSLKQGEYFSDRKCSNGESWLLFCIFSGNEVGLIDVRHHQENTLFSDHDLVRTIKESWPEYMEQFRLKGMLPGQNYTNEEIGQLRARGISPGLIIDDAVYMGPGMGVTSASTSLRVTDKASRLLGWIDQLASFACDESGFIQNKIKQLGVENPRLELCITAQGFAIYETQSKVAFKLPKNPDNEEAHYSAKMIDLFCPDWAISKYLS